MQTLTITIAIQLPDGSHPEIAIQPTAALEVDHRDPDVPPLHDSQELPQGPDPHESTPVTSNGRETYARQLLESFGFHDVGKLLSQFAAERVIDVCTHVRGREDLQNPAGYVNTVLRRGWRLPVHSKSKGRSQ